MSNCFALKGEENLLFH